MTNGLDVSKKKHFVPQPSRHINFTPWRGFFSSHRAAWANALVAEVTQVWLILFACLSIAFLTRLSIFLHVCLPSPIVNKHPNNTSNCPSFPTHTDTPLCPPGGFLFLFCDIPSLHPIITSDCNRHLCSQSSFYFLLEKGNDAVADTFYTHKHTHTQWCLLVSSALAAGLDHPDCSHSTFTAHKGVQRCQNAVRLFKRGPVLFSVCSRMDGRWPVCIHSPDPHRWCTDGSRLIRHGVAKEEREREKKDEKKRKRGKTNEIKYILICNFLCMAVLCDLCAPARRFSPLPAIVCPSAAHQGVRCYINLCLSAGLTGRLWADAVWQCAQELCVCLCWGWGDSRLR